MNEKYSGEIGIGLSGKYRIQVVDSKTDEIVTDYGWHKNLIVNQGMDLVAQYMFAQCTQNAYVGTGSRPNSITSSAQTITQSGNLIGLQGSSPWVSFSQSLSTNGTWSYANIAEPGDIIVDQAGSQSVVITASRGTILTVSSSYTYTIPRTFTIWKTSQTSLQGMNTANPIVSYLGGYTSTSSYNCGAVVSSSTINLRRTYNFTTETQTQSYTEVGVGYSTKLFSRVVLPQTVSLSPMQQLRMSYDLFVYMDPSLWTPTTMSYNVVGWPVLPATNTLGTQSFQNFCISSIDSDGNTIGSGYNGYGDALEPYANGGICIWASKSTASLYTGSILTSGGANNRDGDYLTPTSTVVTPYVPGSYTQVKSNVLSINQATYSINSMGMGQYNNIYPWFIYPNDQNGQVITFLFTQPQTKTNLQTLTLSYRWRWYRVLQ